MRAKVKFAEFSVMAKSKTGGTRAYIRGRIGSDVYSVGKTSDGKKQQVVRSLAETVSNPRTESQMFGRMIMSTVMQAVSALKPIIDHSFDGFPAGQPCISEFIRRNYALIKADALAHPASANTFGLVKYGEKGAKGGLYVVSAGSVAVPSTMVANKAGVDVELTAQDMSVGAFRASANIGADGYLTWVGIKSDGTAVYARVHIKAGVSDDTVISSENINTVFEQEGTIAMEIEVSTGMVSFNCGLTTELKSGTNIISKYENGSWKHSNATMLGTAGFDYASDVALPTYPVGDALFLNGGDI
jgi:hypothetical protein